MREQDEELDRVCKGDQEEHCKAYGRPQVVNWWRKHDTLPRWTCVGDSEEKLFVDMREK